MLSRDFTLPPKQTGSSVWIGSDLAKRENEWLAHLSPAEISELESAAEPLVNDSFNIGTMTQAQFVLPNLSITQRAHLGSWFCRAERFTCFQL
jgi:hypothetical protein